MREEIQRRLEMTRAMADDSATVFCVQPFALVEQDSGEKLGRLLARVMADPDHSLLVVTGTAFVFAFRDHTGQGENNGTEDLGAVAQSSPPT